MKRLILTIISILVIMLSAWLDVPDRVCAGSLDDSADMIDGILDDSSGGIMSGNGISVSAGDLLSGLTPSGIISWIKDRVTENIRAPFTVFSVLVSVSLLSSAFTGMFSSGDTVCRRPAETVSVLAAVLSAASSAGGSLSAASQAIEDGSLFMMSFVPVMSGVTAVSGGAVTAGSYSLIVIGFCELASEFSSRILMPSVSLCLCISVIDAVNPQFSLRGILTMLKKTMSLLLGLVMTIFAGLLSLENIAGGNADSVAVKTGRYLVSNLVPVVGRPVSDTCSAVYGSIGILKTGVGTAGIAVIILTAAVPLIRLFLFRAALAAAGAVSEMLGCSGLKNLLGDLETVFGMMISIVVVFLVMLTVSTALVMRMTIF